MTTPITSDIILRPRITEKSGIMGEALNVYTFEVTKNATKDAVAKAVKTLYKVTPTKIRVINLPAKKVFVRGRKGTQSAVKKALVYLKKGDKIDLA
ncbi:MAG: 50S ribosomal protein L23 [Patescibacteria group bacterium]